MIPQFNEQISRGGPVTVTHQEITSYIRTIPEAAWVVLYAAAIGHSGQVLVLDMGEPVKIADVARDLIRLGGRIAEEIGIVFSGLRPGEKLYEELLADSDETIPISVSRLRVARLAAQNSRFDEGWPGPPATASRPKCKCANDCRPRWRSSTGSAPSRPGRDRPRGAPAAHEPASGFGAR